MEKIGIVSNINENGIYIDTYQHEKLEEIFYLGQYDNYQIGQKVLVTDKGFITDLIPEQVLNWFYEKDLSKMVEKYISQIKTLEHILFYNENLEFEYNGKKMSIMDYEINRIENIKTILGSLDNTLGIITGLNENTVDLDIVNSMGEIRSLSVNSKFEYEIGEVVNYCLSQNNITGTKAKSISKLNSYDAYKFKRAYSYLLSHLSKKIVSEETYLDNASSFLSDENLDLENTQSVLNMNRQKIKTIEHIIKK